MELLVAYKNKPVGSSIGRLALSQYSYDTATTVDSYKLALEAIRTNPSLVVVASLLLADSNNGGIDLAREFQQIGGKGKNFALRAICFTNKPDYLERVIREAAEGALPGIIFLPDNIKINNDQELNNFLQSAE